MNPVINVNGLNVEIVNLDEFKAKLLDAVRFQLEGAIIDEIQSMKLQSSGQLLKIDSERYGDSVEVWSAAPHAIYIEYGTAGTRKGVKDPFGESTRGANPSRKMPLTKDGNDWKLKPELERWAKKHGFKPKGYFNLAKHIQMYGLEPFAPFRKVIYNDKKMKEIVEKAVKAASS